MKIEVAARNPEHEEALKKILEEYQNGEMTEEELYELMGKFEKAVEPSKGQLSLFEESQRLGFDLEDLFMGGEETGPLRLNPLYLAGILERLQFDGDIPELRTGPMPREGSPAVPVRTTARNPVMIGAQLEGASEGVLKLLGETISKSLPQKEGETSEDFPLMSYTKDMEPSTYKRGALPVPVKAEEVKGSDLALFDEKQKQKFAWKSVSTTQGRKSVLEILTTLMEDSLDASIFSRAEEGQETPEEVFEWSFRMSGEGSTQSNFCFVDTCAGYFKNRIKAFQKEREMPVKFLIHTIDRISDREVGWKLSVFK